MNRRLPWLLVFCLLSGFFSHIHAQSVVGGDQFDYSPKTPAVAAMQKMVDVPISYYSGSANISIPLHVVNSKSIKIPLSANYETSGIKADQEPSLLGLGWTLKAGGMISRSVVGNPDEGLVIAKWKDSSYTPSSGSTPGYWHTWWESPVDSVASGFRYYGGYFIDNGHSINISQVSSDITTHNQLVKTGQTIPSSLSDWMFYGLNDDGPDWFYFNFGDYSGKFFFGSGRVPIIVPYNKDLKIVPVLHTAPASSKFTDNYFDSWAITTPEGITYYFGETTASKGFVYFGTAGVRPNSWQLTKVVNHNTKDSVMLTYLPDVVYHDTKSPRQDFIDQTTYDTCKDCGYGIRGWGSGSGADPAISAITTRTEQVNFYYSTLKLNGDTIETYNKLDSIVVGNIANGTKYKKIQFDFGRFQSGRLKLKEALVMNYQHTQVLPYTFNYYDTSFQKIYRRREHDSVPFFNGLAQDFWGYYNDAVSNAYAGSLYLAKAIPKDDYLLPKDTSSYTINRSPAWPQMQRDILNEIIYPTGGKTKLTYEPHTASVGRLMNGSIGDFETYIIDPHHHFNITDTIGGLRVKQIAQIDPVRNDTLIKTFSYTLPGSSTSSGFLHISPSIIIDVTASFPDCGNSYNHPKYLLSTDNIQTGTGSNYHVTYKYVTEAQVHNNIKNGYTRYEFYDDTNTDSTFYFNVCDNVNNNCAIGALDVMAPWQEKKPLENLLSGTPKSTSIYNSNDQLISQERESYLAIRYPGINRVVELSTILSTKICDYAGPPRLPIPGQPSNRMLYPPDQSYMYMHTSVLGKMAVLQQQKISDFYDLTGLKKSDTTQYFYQSPNHISQTASKTRDSNADTIVSQVIYSLDLKDINGTDSLGLQMRNASMNVPVAQFISRNGQVVAGGYSLYRRTSAVDSNSILQREQYKLTTTVPLAPATLNLTSTYPKLLNFPASYFQRINTLSYDNDNNVIQIIQKDQNVNGFIWGYNNTALTAKVANAGSSEIAFTSFETNDNGNWTVPAGVRSNTGFTGQQSYTLSNGSVSLIIPAPGKKVVVSYWSNGGAATVNGVAATAGPARNGWTYYEHLLPETTTTITVSGSVTIDELRLYPAISQMTSYTYDPLVGVTSVTGPDNRTAYYEYDTLEELTAIRDIDRNIVKAADYRQAGFGTTSAVWRPAGQTRCKPCAANAAYVTNVVQSLNVDLNKNSSTWNTYQWVDTQDTSICRDVSAWSNTATATRCLLDGNGQSTGYQQQEQIDLNPCSPTYNTTRWVNISFNTVCVACTGTDRRLVLGNCETGHKVYTLSQAILGSGGTVTYNCTYHLEWSDCYKGPDVVETGFSSPCTIGLSCSDW
ncbi:YD repeat-containing protein [Chitinophaga costaii]|uniref:YD repeat-containing protein n=1 Tax=Chitinophaga costaii TaxID=1335309 RepID=A0A1C4G7N9_9BACT|nr:hypothetical protein [Chitinophaga costaii]PUZ19492.1 hypothetical protein DCM91_20555 [Chitinophaga costaii]SCC64217.1 YD repeat-containing protein [Chitinophaga costaii]